MSMADAATKTVSRVTLDGNEAAASVAYRLSEVVAIYPITPSSPMGEHADAWAAAGRTNVWGSVPTIVEMQSEGGAAGAVHGALQGGSLATTFTASQGLLLMVPNMFKIAGELLPFCMHVASRTIATHALSIFGDHSDVMACRSTGFALLASSSVQEAQDLALVAHAATLRSRIPFLHFFDGFRTSHEVATIEPLPDDVLRALVDETLVQAHRKHGLTPDHPVLRGTAENPDTFFQAREAANSFYSACPAIVQECMDELAKQVGRAYRLVDYSGHPAAERVIVVMGSGAETARETADWLVARGERVGVLQVRLYRPFPREALLAALPRTVRSLAVLDRTKEPGAPGEPLYLDVLAALRGRRDVRLIGGRYGLSSKEFTPGMTKAVFDELAREAPKESFTIGIKDDLTHTSLDWDRELEIELEDVSRAVFFGLGSDGTVSANKSSIKIVAEETGRHAQGYFVYDSKKAGAVTVSHLRISSRPIRAPYLVGRAGFVACHLWSFLDKQDVLASAAPGAVLLLNAPFPAERVWDELSREVQEGIVEKKLRVHAIDALAVAKAQGMGSRINTVMQTCYFALSGFLPREEAIARIKESIAKAYRSKGEAVVARNFAAVDATLAELHEVPVPAAATASRRRPPTVPEAAPDFVKRVTALMLEGKGDLLPVSAFPVDGTWPTGTTRWEKRSLAHEIPAWDRELCIQCNKCAFVCPHAAIRAAVFPEASLAGAPSSFASTAYRGREYPGFRYAIQVAPDDCTGCNLCIQVCPAKDKSNPRHKALDAVAKERVLEGERASFEFFLGLPPVDRATVHADVKGSQFFEPLFEFSGACAGCGETPYLKLLTQLLGDRLIIANATGCSSIYGGNLPTTPYTTDRAGRGPAWANSLFEDNAEFGLGIRLAADHRRDQARALVTRLAPRIGDELAKGLLESAPGEAAIAAQRARIVALRGKLASLAEPDARRLELFADDLVRRSVWLVGGDGWAYDIGFGGLDHVLALGHDVKVLVLDTEVYSNTGGQQSKATPLGAAAKFASSGKSLPKKDLGLMAMTYGSVYVARIAFGAKDTHTAQVLQEAEAFPGPALVIAYSPCIAHGYDLASGLDQQKLAVASGYWPLYRFDPRRLAKGESAFQLDSAPPKARVADFARNETRFRMVEQQDPARYRTLMAAAESDARRRVAIYEGLARAHAPAGNGH
jgi:pyruvate-ferredoxin/flavodoxin oxidoreductase